MRLILLLLMVGMSLLDSFLHSLIFDDLLPRSSLTVVVMSKLTSVSQIFNGRFITLQGFNEEAAKSYIQIELGSNLER